MYKLIQSLKFIFVFCVTSVLIVSCGDDTKENEIVVNQISFEINNGFIEDHGEKAAGVFDFDITLASSEITYNQAIGDFEGSGTYLFLDLNSDREIGLSDGTYQFNTQRDVFTFSFGDLGLDVNFTTGTGESLFVSAGSITVSGDKIDFDVTLENGSTAVGNYTGPLTKI